MSVYKELLVKVYLLKDINKKDINEAISSFVNYAMNKDVKLATLHKGKGYKGYSLSSLSPTEKDGIYNKDEIYEFTIRSFNFQLIDRFKKSFEKFKSETFIVFSIRSHLIDIKYIKEAHCLTPAIITLENENKLKCLNLLKDDVEKAKNQIFVNLLKKYNFFNKLQLKLEYSDIFEDIVPLHNIAIICNYKGIKLLGYKYLLKFKNNEIAQQIAEIALVNGIGEKNTISFGFINTAKGVTKLVR